MSAIRALLALAIFEGILFGAIALAVWVDRRYIEPAVARASARALGLTVDEYRALRAEFWRRQRARFHIHWFRYDGYDCLRGGIYFCRWNGCQELRYGPRR